MKEPSPHCFHTSPAPCCCFPVFQRVNGAHRGHQLCKPVYLVFGVCGGVNGLSPPCCAAALHKSSMLSRSVLQGLELNPFLLLCFPLAAVSVTSQHTGVQSQQLNTQEAWLRGAVGLCRHKHGSVHLFQNERTRSSAAALQGCFHLNQLFQRKTGTYSFMH